MIVPKNIEKRIAKQMTMKPELPGVFYQQGYEYITNTFYFVKVPKAEGIDAKNVPMMKVAEDNALSSDNIASPRFDLGYIMDMLEILKKNGTRYVDISINQKRAMKCVGLSSLNEKDNVASGVLMAIVK